jgi:hypothetical protein
VRSVSTSWSPKLLVFPGWGEEIFTPEAQNTKSSEYQKNFFPRIWTSAAQLRCGPQ